jgi:hypothetical protein
MTGNALQNIEQIESTLWDNADQFRANARLATNENAMPAFGVPRGGNANVARMQPSVHRDAGSGTSVTRITRRFGVA